MLYVTSTKNSQLKPNYLSWNHSVNKQTKKKTINRSAPFKMNAEEFMLKDECLYWIGGLWLLPMHSNRSLCLYVFECVDCIEPMTMNQKKRGRSFWRQIWHAVYMLTKHNREREREREGTGPHESQITINFLKALWATSCRFISTVFYDTLGKIKSHFHYGF